MKIGFFFCGIMLQFVIDVYGDYIEFYVEFLGGQGFFFEFWNVYEGNLFDLFEDVDGWLVSGLCYGVYEDYVWIFLFEDFICISVEVVCFIVGICFGY